MRRSACPENGKMRGYNNRSQTESTLTEAGLSVVCSTKYPRRCCGAAAQGPRRPARRRDEGVPGCPRPARNAAARRAAAREWVQTAILSDDWTWRRARREIAEPRRRGLQTARTLKFPRAAVRLCPPHPSQRCIPARLDWAHALKRRSAPEIGRREIGPHSENSPEWATAANDGVPKIRAGSPRRQRQAPPGERAQDTATTRAVTTRALSPLRFCKRSAGRDGRALFPAGLVPGAAARGVRTVLRAPATPAGSQR